MPPDRSSHDHHFYCACGHSAELRAEAIPRSWLDPAGGLSDRTLRRLRCSACGRRGRPQQITLSPIENRDKSRPGSRSWVWEHGPYLFDPPEG